MGKPTISKEQLKWVLANCPSTGDEVVGSGWDQQFSTSSGRATWWKCPSCGGWHITTVSKCSGDNCPDSDSSIH